MRLTNSNAGGEATMTVTLAATTRKNIFEYRYHLPSLCKQIQEVLRGRGELALQSRASRLPRVKTALPNRLSYGLRALLLLQLLLKFGKFFHGNFFFLIKDLGNTLHFLNLKSVLAQHVHSGVKRALRSASACSRCHFSR